MRIRSPKSTEFINRPLSVDDAMACSLLHKSGFPIGWSSVDFENLIFAPAIFGDGSFAPKTNELVGFSLSRLVAGEAEILTIIVAKLMRDSRLGTEILSTHLNTLRQAGAKKVFLEVAEDNTAARRLYGKFKFEEVGQRPSYYRDQAGVHKNALVLMLAV